MPLLRGVTFWPMTFLQRSHRLLMLLLQLLTLLCIRGAPQLFLMPRLKLRAFGGVARVEVGALLRLSRGDIRRRRRCGWSGR